MTATNIWDAVLARIETKVNRHSFYTWFKPTGFISERTDGIRVRVPNTLFRDWLTKHYSAVLEEALREVDRGGSSLEFITDEALAAAPEPPSPAPPLAEAEPKTPNQTRLSRASVPATPSTPSSSDPRISSRMPPAAPSPRRRRARTTRCSSTAASAWARRT